MSPSVQGTQGSGRLDVLALSELLAAQRQGKGGTIVPGSQESVKTLLESMAGFSDLLPELEEPSTGTARASVPGGLSMGGLSLETLLDAVGFEQRRTETRAGISSLEARAQERAEANEEKIKSIQEQLEKSKSQGFLDGLLKAFKYIGMALAAIGSVAMIAAGAVGLAAGGSGAALIAVGVASMALLASSITEEATGGKVGFSPARPKECPVNQFLHSQICRSSSMPLCERHMQKGLYCRLRRPAPANFAFPQTYRSPQGITGF